MRKFLFSIAAVALALLAVATPAKGAVIVTYDIPQGGAGFTSFAPTATAGGITAGNLAAVGAISPNTFSNHFYFTGWDTTVNLGEYYQNTITVASGQQLVLDNVTYSVESTSLSGGSFQVRSSLDNYASVIDQFNANGEFVTNRTTSLSGLGPITGSVTFRFYATAPFNTVAMGFANHQPGGLGSGLADVGQDIQFNGTVTAASPVPEPGSIILLATGGIGLVGGAIRRRRARKTEAA